MSTIVNETAAQDALSSAPRPRGERRSGLQRSLTDFGGLLWRNHELLPHDLPRVGASGVDTQRILLIECGMLGAIGVTSHELGLAGHLARTVRAWSGRGQIVDVVNCPRPNADSIARTITSQPLWRFDAVVIVIGAPRPFANFRLPRHDAASAAELVASLDRLSSAGTRAILAGVEWHTATSAPAAGTTTPPSAVPLFQHLEKACATSEKTEFVRVASELDPAAMRTESASVLYESWARAIGGPLSAALGQLPSYSDAPLAASARAQRDRQQYEPERMAAVRSSTDSIEPRAEINRLLHLLRGAYGTQYAAVNIIDGERQWSLASTGPEALTNITRSSSFCAVAITQDSPLLVPDAAEDLLFADYPAVREGKLGFYAGIPIEDPAGLRLGALCVFDSEPRLDYFDTTILNLIAHRIEAELWSAAVGF